MSARLSGSLSSQGVLLACVLAWTASTGAAMTLSEAEEQYKRLDESTQYWKWLGPAREHTTRIPLAGVTFTDIAVHTVTTGSDPTFQLQLRFTRPQDGIESVRWRAHRLDQITTLLELLSSGQLVALIVQTKEATANGVTPCKHCDLRGWHYQPNVAPGGRP